MAVVLEVQRLIFGKSEILKHPKMSRTLDVEYVEEPDILAGHSRLAESFVDAVHPVGHRYGIQQALHLYRVHQAQHSEFLVILGCHRYVYSPDL